MTAERAYEHCRRLTARASSNFYYGMRLLPHEKRRAIWAVYAFSRACDDAVDEHEGRAARLRLNLARDAAERAWQDGFAGDSDPVVVALGDAVRRYGLSIEPFLDLIEGMRMDLEIRTYATFDELRLYCERVAGSVGRVCVSVFGHDDPAAPHLAVELGVALQLTNILRDIKEDAGRGRVYLPLDELMAAGLRPDGLAAARRTPAFERLMATQVERARIHFERTAPLARMVAADARPCLLALDAVYRELLARIEASGYDVLGPRVRIPTGRKLQLVGALLWQQRTRRRGA